MKFFSGGSFVVRSSLSLSSHFVSSPPILGIFSPSPLAASSVARSAPATKRSFCTLLRGGDRLSEVLNEIATPIQLFSSSIAPSASIRGESFETRLDPKRLVSPLSPRRVYTTAQVSR